MDLKELIHTSAHRLDEAKVAFGHGTLNAQDEAAWLILWQLQLPLDLDFTEDVLRTQERATALNLDLKVADLSAAHIQACQALIEQRIATR